MNSRQRVINSIEHRPVDRIPMDLGMHFSTGISVFAYKNLREYLGMDSTKIEMADLIQCLARVDEDILERFHIDTILLYPRQKNPYKFNFRGNYEFYVPENYKPEIAANGDVTVSFGDTHLLMPEGGFFFDGGWPDFNASNQTEHAALVRKDAERIYKETDKFTMFMGFGAFMSGLDFLCDALTDPDAAHALQKKILSYSIVQLDAVASELGEFVQAIAVNSDLGAQNGPLCSQETYAEFVAPYLKTFCKRVKEISDYKIFMHSCGSIEPLIPQLIDCGIEILNPIQVSAAHMNPVELKAKYGDKICFWGGGCNTQQVLNMGTPCDVVKNVKELMCCFAPGSGFVFNQVHNIMGDIRPENIVAMLDTAYVESLKYGSVTN